MIDFYKPLKYLFLLIVLGSTFTLNAQILTFDFAGIAGSESTANSSSNHANLNSSTISRGSGLTAGANGDRFNATGWTTSASVDADDYMEFTITPQATYQFSVSSIVFQVQRSGTGPVSMVLRNSLDGYTLDLDAVKTLSGTSTQSVTYTFNQNNSSAAVTYRVYMYSAGSAAGSCGIGDGTGADITVNGSVSSTPAVPTLTTPTATGITNTSATLGANITNNGGSSISDRGTIYKTSNTVIITDNPASEGGTSTGAFSHSRTGLSPQTQYFYAGYATNTTGTGLSSETCFRTLSNPATVQASNLSATAASSSQINLTFTGATFPASGATQAGYVVIYSTGTPALSSANGQAPAAGVGTIFATSATVLPTTPATTINVTGLTQGTSYNFLIVPYTWDGTNAGTYNYLTTSAPTDNESTLAGPVISITGDPIDFGSIVTGSSSAEGNYTVSGSNLTEDITITAPTGFLVSTDANGPYQASIDLPESGGTVNSTIIYATYSPSSATGAASGNIAHTSTGATTQNLAVTGNALSTEPTTQSSVTFGTRTTSSMVVNFSGGNGSKRIVVARASSAVSHTPSDAVASSGVNSVFTSASDQGSGNRIVYDGSANTVTVTGLTANTTYHFAVFEYNEGTGTSQNYMTTSPGTASQASLDNAVYTSGNSAADVSQDLNTLANSGTGNTALATGWASSASTYDATAGSATTAGLYSCGTGTNTDRAIGSVATNATQPSFGFKIINTTGDALTSILVSYTGEQWRLGATGRTDQLDFQYSTDATAIGNGTWNDVNSLDFTAPVTTGTVGALDGNQSANRTAVSAVISGLNLTNNATIWFRWVDANATGSDDILAVDDITITPFSTTGVTGNTNLGAGTYNNLNVIDNTTLAGDAIINGKINLQTGAKIVLNGNHLTIGGAVTGTMIIEGSNTSSLTINGSGTISSISFDQTSSGTTNRLQNFTINRNGATVTLSNALEINAGGTLTMTDGTLASNGNLSLISTISGTARIAAIGATADITGNVNVQRWMVGGATSQRGWRTMSSPVSGFTFNMLTDDIFVTGPGGSTNGFDASGTNSSVMLYEENPSNTRGWTSISTTTDAVDPGIGMLVFFRGDRTQTASLTNSSTVPSSFALDFTGTINKGTISPLNLSYHSTGDATADGWNFVGNPYPSEIDYDAVTKTANVSSTYWVLNPNTGNYVNRLGNEQIAIGQGFFVQVDDVSQSITFEESSKAITSPTAYFKTQLNPVTIKMFEDSVRYDVAWLDFKPGANKNYVFNEDAVKLTNSRINLGMITADQKTVQRSINPELLPQSTDTFVLKTTSFQSGNYWLSFENLASVPAGKHIFLVDQYNNNWIDLNTTPVYQYSINNAVPATHGNRFLVIITDQYTSLPVKLVSFSGKRTGKVNQLSWSTVQEQNIRNFAVLRSYDGIVFETIALVKATNSSALTNYTITDQTVRGNAYYKLAINELNGNQGTYSQVIAIHADNVSNSVSIYPNPATENISIIAGENRSVERVNIYTLNGNKVLESEVYSNLNISDLDHGIYIVEIITQFDVERIKFVKK